MGDNADRELILRQIWYSEDGFGSQKKLYDDAKKLIPNITHNEVKTWLGKQKMVQTRGFKTFNSYIADGPLEEVAFDLAVFTKSAKINDGFQYAMVAVDVFSKFCHVVAMKNNDTQSGVNAMKEVINKIGKFKRLISDREGFTETTEFRRLLNEHNIKHIITSAPSAFAERQVKTFKDYVFKRVEGLKTGEEEWVKFIPNFLKYYNNTEHSTTKEKPVNAMKPEYKMNVLVNIRKRAQFNRTYEPLQVNDLVRTYVKKTVQTKNRDPRYSKEIYRITVKRGDQYLINDHRNRVWNRHELFKVPDGTDND